MAKLRTGEIIWPLTLETIQGGAVDLPGGVLTHLQFRRYAGCPICNLHLRGVAKRLGEIEAAGVREVAVFHSKRETMAPLQRDLPFAVVADPAKKLYADFGVESSLRAILHPRAWAAGMRGARAGHPQSRRVGEGGHLGLPADFLIGPDGRILALRYGKHADDQWDVDEIVRMGKQFRSCVA